VDPTRFRRLAKKVTHRLIHPEGVWEHSLGLQPQEEQGEDKRPEGALPGVPPPLQGGFFFKPLTWG